MRKYIVLNTVVSVACLAILFNAVGAQAGQVPGKFFGNKKTEYPKWFKNSFLNLKTDVAEAKDSGRRLMIIFHQSGCPYCNALVNRNFSQKDIEQKVRKNFDVVGIDMWGDVEVMDFSGSSLTEKEFAASLSVQFTPTVLFFNELGEIILRLNGYQPPRRFKLALDYVAGRKEKSHSYRDYAKANWPPGTKGLLHGEDFFAKSLDLNRKSGVKGRPLAVFFEQKDCPNCDYLHTKILPDQPTRSIIKQFDVVQLDMWSNTPLTTPSGNKTTARQWAKELDVKYAPSIVLFNAMGKEVIRSEAFFKLFHTQGIFAYVASGAYQKQPSFQRYLSARAEHFRAQGQDVDIWRTADQQPKERQ